MVLVRGHVRLIEQSGWILLNRVSREVVAQSLCNHVANGTALQSGSGACGPVSRGVDVSDERVHFGLSRF